MAITKGRAGTVKVAAAAVAEIRDWSLSESAATNDDTTINDTAKKVSAGLTSWSGSVKCFWDPTDTTGQETLAVGASVTLNLYPGGDAVGQIEYGGTAIITGIERSGSNEGNVEASFSFEGSGVLAQVTVAV